MHAPKIINVGQNATKRNAVWGCKTEGLCRNEQKWWFIIIWPVYIHFNHEKNQWTWSSSLLLLRLTSPAALSSESWDKALGSSPPPLVCRVCKSWSLGRFQDARVAIQRIRAPNATRRTPRTLTKTASAGESLYAGLRLSNANEKWKWNQRCTVCHHWFVCHKPLLLHWYLQAKNEFLGDSHECHSYDTGEDEMTSVDV